jgi:hypothetical protein
MTIKVFKNESKVAFENSYTLKTFSQNRSSNGWHKFGTIQHLTQIQPPFNNSQMATKNGNKSINDNQDS